MFNFTQTLPPQECQNQDLMSEHLNLSTQLVSKSLHFQLEKLKYGLNHNQVGWGDNTHWKHDFVFLF